MEHNCTFACPECRGLLALAEEGYRCAACNKTWPVIDGIAVFSDIDNYYGEIRQLRMKELLDDAERKGYREALKSFISDPFIYTYTTDESRAIWVSIVPHDAGTDFLEIGCGWGTNAIPISREVKELVALDATYERVKFVGIRAAQENAANVVPVMGTAVSLPFPDESFDVVSFNGVLEWLGAIDKDVDPKSIQKTALGEAYRVLRPGGHVYIGIENRWSLLYFLGKPDDHSFIRFTSLLPRGAADLYCRLRSRGKYYTHTHSLNTYISMLSGTGFRDIAGYLPWPDYRNPKQFIPLEYESIMRLLDDLPEKGGSLSIRRRFYLSLLKWITSLERRGRMCHSFCFTGKK